MKRLTYHFDDSSLLDSRGVNVMFLPFIPDWLKEIIAERFDEAGDVLAYALENDLDELYFDTIHYVMQNGNFGEEDEAEVEEDEAEVEEDEVEEYPSSAEEEALDTSWQLRQEEERQRDIED